MSCLTLPRRLSLSFSHLLKLRYTLLALHLEPSLSPRPWSLPPSRKPHPNSCLTMYHVVPLSSFRPSVCGGSMRKSRPLPQPHTHTDPTDKLTFSCGWNFVFVFDLSINAKAIAHRRPALWSCSLTNSPSYNGHPSRPFSYNYYKNNLLNNTPAFAAEPLVKVAVRPPRPLHASPQLPAPMKPAPDPRSMQRAPPPSHDT